MILLRILTLLTRAMAILAGLATFFVMLLIALDVTLRFFGGGVPGTLDIVTYFLMISVAFLALPRVEQQDAMISVDALFDALKGSGKRWVVVFASAVTTLVFSGVAYASFLEALNQYSNGAYAVNVAYLLPIWPAYFFVPAAFGLATVISVLRTILAVSGRFSSDALKRGYGLDMLVDEAVIRSIPKTGGAE